MRIGNASAARAAALVLAAAMLAGGCASTGDKKAGASSGRTTVVVFAAASLTDAFNTIAEKFEAAHQGVQVKLNYGGSSGLAQQIDQGAPADVFAAANPATMKQVTDAGNASAPTTFTRNRLEIAVPPADPGKVTALKDLANPKLKVVLCAPQVPCGAAAQKVIKAAGLTVRPASQEEDVKAALTKVELNEADAALVYRTDVKAAAGKVRGIDFPESAQAINDYPIATLKKAPHPDLATQFVQFVLSDTGAATLSQDGFERP